MRIWVSRYELMPRGALNSRIQSNHSNQGVRSGALLRVESEWGNQQGEQIIGYADLHPWPELEDLPLDQQLKLLRDHQLTPLTASSLRFAKIDAQARARGVSAFQGLKIPESHYLVTDLDLVDEKTIDQIRTEGWKRIKVKVGRLPSKAGMAKETSILREIASGVGDQIKLRLDFNAVFDLELLQNWLQSAQSFLTQIDFLEDPLPWNPEHWQAIRNHWGVRLASDREGMSIPTAFLSRAFSNSVDVIVIKPATHGGAEAGALPDPVPGTCFDPAPDFQKNLSWVVTSYLDHPVGQMCAAYDAAQLGLLKSPGSLEICGLLSHRAYEKNLFSEQLQTSGPLLEPTLGTGWGWDDQLAQLKWELLR